jgi:hypothetical protein
MATLLFACATLTSVIAAEDEAPARPAAPAPTAADAIRFAESFDNADLPARGW